MAEGIKDWIRNETGKPGLSDDAILISRLPGGGTRIVLLDGACCRPSLEISKAPQDISAEDIRSRRAHLLHQH